MGSASNRATCKEASALVRRRLHAMPIVERGVELEAGVFEETVVIVGARDYDILRGDPRFKKLLARLK